MNHRSGIDCAPATRLQYPDAELSSAACSKVAAAGKNAPSSAPQRAYQRVFMTPREHLRRVGARTLGHTAKPGDAQSPERVTDGPSTRGWVDGGRLPRVNAWVVVRRAAGTSSPRRVPAPLRGCAGRQGTVFDLHQCGSPTLPSPSRYRHRHRDRHRFRCRYPSVRARTRDPHLDTGNGTGDGNGNGNGVIESLHGHALRQVPRLGDLAGGPDEARPPRPPARSGPASSGWACGQSCRGASEARPPGPLLAPAQPHPAGPALAAATRRSRSWRDCEAG